MTEWILTHPRLAFVVFFGGLFVAAGVLGGLCVLAHDWWLDRKGDPDAAEGFAADAPDPENGRLGDAADDGPEDTLPAIYWTVADDHAFMAACGLGPDGRPL